jgi:hypothetical protein|nr:MAG TPA: hypothetical protein [Caudoviricetes sp.]
MGRKRIREIKTYTITTSYTHYSKKIRETPFAKQVFNKRVYTDVMKDFLAYLGDTLIETGKVVLPKKMGNIEIEGSPQKISYDEEGHLKGLSVDWKATRELWKEDEEAGKNKQYIYHLNENTNGIKYKIKWFKTKMFALNKAHYNFIMNRSIKRRVAAAIKGGKEYRISFK